MYSYNFGYGSYEDSDFYQITHEEKYSDDEFQEILHEAILKAICHFLKQRSNGVTREDTPPEVLEKLSEEDKEYSDIHFSGYFDCAFSFAHGSLLKYVHIVLIRDYGFEPLVFQAKWGCFGWANFLADNWKQETDSEASSMYRAREYIKKRFTNEDKIRRLEWKIEDLEDNIKLTKDLGKKSDAKYIKEYEDEIAKLKAERERLK